MKKNKIDLSDIKTNDLDDTGTFTDILSKKEMKEMDDIEEMLNEKKRNTKDLTKEVEKANKIVKDEIEDTKVFDIDEEKKKVKKEKSKKVKVKKDKETKKTPSFITDVGTFIIVVVGYFIYCLLYTNFYDNKKLLLVSIVSIILIFILYAFSILFSNKITRILVIVIFILLIMFVSINVMNSIGIKLI